MQLLKQTFCVAFLLFLLHTAEAQQAAVSSMLHSSANENKGFQSLLNTVPDANDTGFFVLNTETKLYVKSFLEKREKYFGNMQQWGKPYFLLYNELLTANNLPIELKYLSVVESGLSANILSDKGALGPWQLMPEVALQYGLKVGAGIDERTDFKKSTMAACSLIKDLYSQYKDWLLVIAAYNAGSGRVNAAIKKAGTADFWDLQYFLPEETRNHVKRYIAAHYFFEGRGGSTTLSAHDFQEREKLLSAIKTKADPLNDIAEIKIIGKYNAVAVSKHLNVDIELFNSLNPSFDKILSEGKYYNLRLPADKITQFNEQKLDILKESVEFFLSRSGAVSSK